MSIRKNEVNVTNLILSNTFFMEIKKIKIIQINRYILESDNQYNYVNDVFFLML